MQAGEPDGGQAGEFDYIVIGAGSSGCVVAGELAADPARRVLVLEAGPAAEDNPETLAAGKYKDAFINEALMWDRVSEPQAGCAGNRLFQGSGRGSGGSGAINAMVYTRGDRLDYAQWRCPGWTWDELLPDFTAVEQRLELNRPPPTRFTQACITAAEQTDFRRKEDLNDGELAGFLGYEWMNMDRAGRERRSSYVAFLKPRLAANNLQLKNHALVEKIVIAGGRATAVRYRHGGQVHTATARCEIIVCAGALETPKLLMLSGLGPAAELARHGIPVICDLPEVGQNLQDHPNVSLFFKGHQPTDCTWAQLYGFHRTGPAAPLADGPAAPLAAGQADTCYVFYSARSSFREGVIRLLPLMLLPLFLYRVRPLVRALRALIKAVFRLGLVQRLVERMYGVVVILGKPQSRGQLRLRGTDPAAHAIIDPNYFADPADLETLVAGAERARRLTQAPALMAWGNHELIPGKRTATAAALRRFIRKNAMTTYHYPGTCSMSALPEKGVVSPELEVHGVRGLRIADASVIPAVPVSALNAPSMLIGYRAARLIKEKVDREAAALAA